jgi:hypothetical protein
LVKEWENKDGDLRERGRERERDIGRKIGKLKCIMT